MQANEALSILDQLLPNYTLNNLQETIFSQTWEGKTYAEIADDCGYDHNYVRDVGFRLWQTLSEALDQKISKSTIKAVLSRYARSQHSLLTKIGYEEPTNSIDLELPDGPVPLDSKLYIERPPIEEQAMASILKPGSLIRLQAPRQMGKTSLLRRMVAYTHHHQFSSVTINLHRADSIIYSSIDRFLRWFCANISYQLGLDANLDMYWNLDIGSKVSCSNYLENYVLPQIEGDLVIALDELDELFQYSDISSEFLLLLRSWYEDAREIEAWQRIRWVLVYAADIYVPRQRNQFSFNIGLAINLPPFSLEQAQELAQRHGLLWAEDAGQMDKLLLLLEMISGRPGLIRLALYVLAQHGTDLEQLIDEAPTQSGIYSSHLRELLAEIYPYPDLQAALRTVVTASEPVTLEPMMAYRLENLGLINLNKNQATSSCGLYRRYFLDFLPPEPLVSDVTLGAAEVL